MTSSEVRLATEKAIRKMSAKEWTNILYATGMIEKPKPKRTGAVIIKFESRAEEAVAFLRENDILCLYEKHARPMQATVLKRDLKKIRAILLDGGFLYHIDT